MTQQQVIYQNPEVTEKKKLRKKRKNSRPNVPISFRTKHNVPEKIPGIPKEVVKEVNKEVVKKDIKKTVEQEEKLADLMKTSNNVLFRCSSIFPFDFFPDDLTIEPTQVNASIKSFFLTRRLISIPVKNISDISVQTSILFASVTVIDKFFSDNSFTVNYLKKEEAKKFRKIAQGLVIADREGIDVSRIDSTTLKKRTEQLGNMRFIES